MPFNLKKILLLLTITPMIAVAAGIGKVNVKSSLGEPLRAELEVYVTDPKELDLAVARLGSQQDYADAGIPEAYLPGVNVELVKKADGRYVIQLNGAQAVNDPYLELLVKLDTKTSNFMRQYTVLLDPPATIFKEEPSVSKQSRKVDVPSQANQSPAKHSSKKQAKSAAHQSAVQKSSSTAGQAKTTLDGLADAVVSNKPYKVHASEEAYTTQTGDVFGKIAQRYQPAGVPLVKVMAAFYEINKNAFVDGDTHKLKSGYSLRIPDEASLNNAGMLKTKKTAVKHSTDTSALPPVKDKIDAPAAVASVEKAPSKQESPTPPKAVVNEAPKSEKVQNFVLKVSPGDAEAAKSNTASGEGDSAANASNAEKGSADSSSAVTPLATDKAEDAQSPAQASSTPLQVDAKKSTNLAANAQNAKSAEASSGFSETLSQYWTLLLVGVGLIALLAFLAFSILKRRRAQNVSDLRRDFAPTLMDELLMDEDSVRVISRINPKVVDAPTEKVEDEPAPSEEELMANQSTEVHLNDVDPLVEAELYMTYGRDRQAEGVLNNALEETPYKIELSLGLLKIYADRKDIASFERVVHTLHDDLGSGSILDAMIWSKVVALGAKIDPENPLYGGTGKVSKLSASERAQAVERELMDNLMPLETFNDGALNVDPSPIGQAASEQEEVAQPLSALDSTAQKSNEIEFTLDDLPAKVEKSSQEATSATAENTQELFSKLKRPTE